jgi:hypothetical protein
MIKSDDFEKWLERAAILEFDGGMGRDEAEVTAATMYDCLDRLSEFRQYVIQHGGQ